MGGFSPTLAEHGDLLWRVGLGSYTASVIGLTERHSTDVPIVQMMLVRRWTFFGW